MTTEFETVHTNEASHSAVEGLELKKLEIAEEEDRIDSSSNFDNNYNGPKKGGRSDYDFELDYCPEGVYKKDHDLWHKYETQMYESEGFDIQDFPGICDMVKLLPLWEFEKEPRLHEDLLRCAAEAISKYNIDAEDDYSVVKIEKANAELCAGFLHYITFQASNSKGEVKTFQAKVYDGIDELEVLLIRLKKNNSVLSEN